MPAFALLAATARRRGGRLLRSYLLFFGCLSLVALKGLWLSYLAANLSGHVAYLSFIVLEAFVPVSAGLYFGLIMLAHGLAFPSAGRLHDRILLGCAACYTVLGWLPRAQAWDNDRQALVLGPLFPVLNATNALLVAWSIGVVLVRFRAIGDPALRRRARAFLLLFIISAPCLLHDLMLFNAPGELPRIRVFAVFFPIVYLVLAIATLSSAWRFLSSPPVPPLPAGPRAALRGERGTSDPSIEEFAERLGRERGLTARERELIPMILRGLGNKEMAAELRISTKTVNNHLSNLYRKAGVRSRFELIGLLLG